MPTAVICFGFEVTFEFIELVEDAFTCLPLYRLFRRFRESASAQS